MLFPQGQKFAQGGQVAESIAVGGSDKLVLLPLLQLAFRNVEYTADFAAGPELLGLGEL